VNSWLTHDPHFQLACKAGEQSCVSLEIRGTVYASPARLQSVFTQDFGSGVFSIPMAERRRHLLAVDWVDTATISRVWPNRIVVSITERSPVAFTRLPIADSARYRLALIDQAGVLMSLPQPSLRAKVRFHLPVVSGLTEGQSEPERSRRIKAVQHLLDDLGPQAADISEVNATSTEDMRVVTEIDGRAVELWIGDQHYRSRYQHFRANYAEIKKHSPESGVFDLRMDDRISAR
jgi:cell division protein FtsQ